MRCHCCYFVVVIRVAVVIVGGDEAWLGGDGAGWRAIGAEWSFFDCS